MTPADVFPHPTGPKYPVMNRQSLRKSAVVADAVKAMRAACFPSPRSVSVTPPTARSASAAGIGRQRVLGEHLLADRVDVEGLPARVEDDDGDPAGTLVVPVADQLQVLRQGRQGGDLVVELELQTSTTPSTASGHLADFRHCGGSIVWQVLACLERDPVGAPRRVVPHVGKG